MFRKLLSFKPLHLLRLKKPVLYTKKHFSVLNIDNEGIFYKKSIDAEVKIESKLNSSLKDANFQDFVMKINHMLTKEEIHKFIQMVDVFQRKVNNYRATQREVFIENFYEKMLIFFHKHNTPDLYKYFLKVDIENIKGRSFYDILGTD